MSRPRILDDRIVTLMLAALPWLLAPIEQTVAAQPGTPRFERAECPTNGEWARAVNRQCGWLVVPESRNHPSAEIRLAVEIFRAREPDGRPPLLFLHGGPAGPGGIRLYSAGIAMSSLPQHRDVVVFDQRGAGFSTPQFCAAYDVVADSVDRLRDGRETDLVLRNARRTCLAELDRRGVDRLAYNTAANAADLLDLRQVLGYSSWDIRAPSYGARLAQEAMLRDPGGIRAVVLASPVSRAMAVRPQQPLATQTALERVFADCARQPSCRNAFPELEQDFYGVFDTLTAMPLSVPISHPSGRSDTAWLDGQRLVAALRDRTASRAQIGRIPMLIHELRSGDRIRAARELVDDGVPSTLLTGRALRELINCYDSYGPDFVRAIDSVNALARPPFRRANDWHCDEWLPRFSDAASRMPVRSDIPTLIVSGYFDDRTPKNYALRIAAALTRVYVVEIPDEGHDPRPTPCHARIMERFLEDPTSKPDESCLARVQPIAYVTSW